MATYSIEGGVFMGVGALNIIYNAGTSILSLVAASPLVNRLKVGTHA